MMRALSIRHVGPTRVRARFGHPGKSDGEQGGRGAAMSVEAARGRDSGAQWGATLAGRGVGAEVVVERVPGAALRRRRALPRELSEARGPAAVMRRDSLFRRSLLVADVIAILAALTLTVA